MPCKGNEGSNAPPAAGRSGAGQRLEDRLPLVIAEAGVNHGGDLGRALEMVHAAAEAGADSVKFQGFRAEEIVAAGAAAAPYQRANTGTDSQFDLLRGLELSVDALGIIAARCQAAGIGFLCTPFDPAVTPALIEMGMERIKIASGELTDAPALTCFGGLGLPLLLSTGMATLSEVEEAVATLRQAGSEDITLLHCTSLYPAPVDSVNLRAMVSMAEHFHLPVGYSDHTLGDHLAVAAVALGAVVIEKHFTLDRSSPGPDHAASLEPAELKEMIRKLQETRLALGDGEKKPAPGEAETARLVRRSWHAVRNLPAGTALSRDDITLKRPADGLAPRDAPIGRRLRHAVAADAPIGADDLVPR